jgi:FHA domain/Domain of unknown function (DUF4388)
MQVILQGSLRHFPPAELLRFLGGGKHEGTLDLQSSAGSRARFFFREGWLIWAEAENAPDVVSVVAGALGFDGAFALVDAVVLPEGVDAQPANVETVIAAAEEQLARANSFPDATMFRVNADKAQVTMSGDEFKTVLRIGVGKTFKELLPDSGKSPAELTSLLRAMEERGLLLREDPKPPEPMPEQTLLVSKRRMASLTGDNGDVHALLDDVYTIGRDPATNTIALTDSSISTHHASVTRTGDTFTVEDLGSRNGTFVNGEKVTAARALADNDVIRFGRMILIFNLAREIRAGETTEREMRQRQPS